MKKLILHQALVAICSAVLLAGCVTLKDLKEAKPLVQNKDYEKMLLGNVAGDYVGNETCLKACHVHHKIASEFKASTMGDQLAKSSSGMMIVDCESCHGPGSEVIEKTKGLDPEKDRAKIKEIMRNNFLNFDELPAGARSLICLRCHTANATFNIHNWNSSSHAVNQVSCSECHPIHNGPDLILPAQQLSARCEDCHQDIKALFSLPSHHPVNERKMHCTDCHDPHGTANPKLLKEATIKETCAARCHTEKLGPFRFEHGDNMEDCTVCHLSHGSINNRLLTIQEPFLCKQCHQPHGAPGTTGLATRYTRCSDCHTSRTLHGTDNPGVAGNDGVGGRFTH